MANRRAWEAGMSKRPSAIYKRLSAWSGIIALALVATGAVLGLVQVRMPLIAELTGYTFGDRGHGADGIGSHFPAAIHSDLWFIVAYGTALAGGALYFRARASSHLGGQAGNFIAVAVIVAVTANLTQDILPWTEFTRGGNIPRIAAGAAA